MADTQVPPLQSNEYALEQSAEMLQKNFHTKKFKHKKDSTFSIYMKLM